jgi:hypothetical protein
VKAEGGGLVSVIALRHALLRPTALRRMLLLAALIPAIVVGLLAMHTVASGMTGHADPAMTGMAMGGGQSAGAAEAHRHPLPEVSTLTSTPGDPGHAMAAMTCILALLVTTILLVVGRQRPGFSFGPRGRPALGRFVAFAALAVDRPPDLTVLSISRV